MVSSAAKKKTDAKFKAAKKNLADMTKGANDVLKAKYGSKYRMNTKKASRVLTKKK